MIEFGMDKHGGGESFVIGDVRIGAKPPEAFSFDTLNLSVFGNLPESYTVTVSKVDQMAPNLKHMAYGGIAFMQYGDEYGPECYIRSDNDIRVLSSEDEDLRQFNADDIQNASVGVKLSVTRGDSFDGERKAYFDNASMKTSNIVWEFSPDGDDWLQLFDLPNREYTRVVLPQRSDRLHLRALSNSPDEWIQKIAVKPHKDLSYATKPQGMGEEQELGLTVSKMGLVQWNKPTGAKGRVTYYVVVNEDEHYFSTYDTSYILEDEYVSSDNEYAVMAYDESGEVCLSETATVS